jgi:quercetin dioxygenase-like cupin family protein
MVRGSDYSGVNRIVARPDADGHETLPPLDACARPLSLPLAADDASGWKPYPLFKGSTPGIGHFSCHVSALNHGCCPHPPHQHDDEEILMLLNGEVDLLLPDLPSVNGAQRKRLNAGEFVYYPAQFAHTLETVSRQPANYLMFKWRNSDGHGPRRAALPFGHFKLSDHANVPAGANGFHCARVLEGTTGWLRTLHGHRSRLAPGAGYDPHSDPYDVALILLEGELESLGQRFGPHSVIFYPAGQPHGLRNPGTIPAVYLVFEFHGDRTPGQSETALSRWISSRLTNRRYWQKRFKTVARSVRKRIRV